MGTAESVRCDARNMSAAISPAQVMASAVAHMRNKVLGDGPFTRPTLSSFPSSPAWKATTPTSYGKITIDGDDFRFIRIDTTELAEIYVSPANAGKLHSPFRISLRGR